MIVESANGSTAGRSLLLHRDETKRVWLSAPDHEYGRVVVKTPSGQTAETLAEFHRLAARELHLTASLPRYAAVRIIQYGPGRHPWLKMEWGGVRWDRAVEPVNTSRRLRLLADLAETLTAIHRAGVIHGDLKPSNTYVRELSPASRAGRRFHVRLADFAYGRRVDEPESSRAGLGTIGYMAPETILTGRCSVRSDLFSLGVMAYETLSGRHPFILSPDDDPLHVCSRSIEETPPDMRDLNIPESSPVLNLIARLLAGDPLMRMSSAEEVAHALRSEVTVR